MKTVTTAMLLNQHGDTERKENTMGIRKPTKKPKDIHENIHPAETKKYGPVVRNFRITDTGILVVLEDRRHELMDEVYEINKTIEVIKRYTAL